MDINGARPYLEAALSFTGGTHTYDDIMFGVEHGTFQFWPGINSAVLTEIIDYPRFRSLHFFLAGGNAAELEAMIPLIEKWGAERGCKRATFTGRRGWRRSFVTQRAGYVPLEDHVEFGKELKP